MRNKPRSLVDLVDRNPDVLSLDDLLREARTLGLVFLQSHDDGTYSMMIEVGDMKLKALSGYGHLTPHRAMLSAIKEAHKVRKAFS